jgi:hypothetical protein
MSGTVVGGWEFVTTAYVLSAVVLGGYCLAVLRRYSRAQARQAMEDQP